MNVLITGGSGMIARKVAEQLKAAGHLAFSLSRKPVYDPLFSGSFLWDPEKKTFDKAAFRDMDAIVHLAGTGIAEKKWTAARKKEIIESRTHGTAFLAAQLRAIPHTIRTIVAASATGYYGDSGDEVMDEQHPAGKGFLAEACVLWEDALNGLASATLRLTILRIGFVIDRTGGALPVMARPVRWGVGAAYGTGDQYISWIDSKDLARVFLCALENDALNGIYNAVAPSPVTNKEFIRTLGKVLHRPVWPIGIPAFVFKTLLGEQAELVLGGQRATADKLLAAGFRFDLPSLTDSLKSNL